MKDLIDRDAVERIITSALNEFVTEVRNTLNGIGVAVSDMPSIEVVRCKDCRYFNNTFPLLHMCNVSGMKMETDDYCSYGERKDENEVKNV